METSPGECPPFTFCHPYGKGSNPLGRSEGRGICRSLGNFSSCRALTKTPTTRSKRIPAASSHGVRVDGSKSSGLDITVHETGIDHPNKNNTHCGGSRASAIKL